MFQRSVPQHARLRPLRKAHLHLDLRLNRELLHPMRNSLCEGNTVFSEPFEGLSRSVSKLVGERLFQSQHLRV